MFQGTPKKIVLMMAILLPWSRSASSEPSAPLSQEMSLKDAIERSQETFARSRIQRADRDAQVEKVRGSWADLGPRVKLDYTLSQFEKEMASQQAGVKVVGRPEVLKLGSMTIAQPITGLGALTKKALFEEAVLEMKQDGYLMSKTEGAFIAADQWLTTFQNDQLVQIAQSSIKAVEQQLRDAVAMERVGRLNRGDVLKLELAVSEAKMRLTRNLSARSTAMASLSEILGLSPQTVIKLPSELPKLELVEESLEKSWEIARGQRLDTKVSRGRVELAEFGKSLVYSQFSPQVNLFMKAERNFGEPFAQYPSRITRSYGVTVSWDIWNNGAQVFALREALDLVVKAEEEAKADESKAMIEVQNMLNGLKSAQEALEEALVAVRLADEAFRIESIRFKTGARSATDLIMAESSHAQAKGRLITAQVDLAKNYFKYQKSIGYSAPKI